MISIVLQVFELYVSSAIQAAVGWCCLYVLAAKYEEIYPPDVSEFVYITDDSYTKRQVPKVFLVYLAKPKNYYTSV